MKKTITPDQIDSTDFSTAERVLAVRADADDGTGVPVWTPRILASFVHPDREARLNQRDDVLIAVENPDDLLAIEDLKQRVIARRQSQGLTAR